MAVKKRDMERVFNKLNIERVECKHHVRGYFLHNGERLFPVYFSFGRGEVPGFVAEKMAKSMALSLDELRRMAKCKISAARYADILVERGIL